MLYYNSFIAGIRLQIRHRGRRTQNNVHVWRAELPEMDELNTNYRAVCKTKTFLYTTYTSLQISCLESTLYRSLHNGLKLQF